MSNYKEDKSNCYHDLYKRHLNKNKLIEKLKKENEKLKECMTKIRKISKLTYLGKGLSWYTTKMYEIRSLTGKCLKEIEEG